VCRQGGIQSSNTAVYAQRRVIAWAIGFFLLAFFVRLIGLPDRQPHFDEWFHIFAARSFLETGEFEFVKGFYERAAAFTLMVAASMKALPFHDLVAARIPALLFGALAVGSMVPLARLHTPLAIALIAALILAFDPLSIEWSQRSRFYTLQVICVLWVVLIGELIGDRPVRSAWPAWLAVALIGVFGIVIQITTAPALAGYALFKLAETRLGTAAFWRAAWARRRIALLAGFALIVLLTILVAPKVWSVMREVDEWSIPFMNDYLFYDDRLRWSYRVFWPLAPLFAIIGVVRWPRATLLCLALIIPVLLAQTLGAMKADRYILLIYPFLAWLWAIGLYEIVRAAIQALTRSAERSLGPASQLRWRNLLISSAVIAAALFAAAGNDSLRLSAKDFATQTVATLRDPGRIGRDPVPYWPEEAARMRTIIRGDGIVASTQVFPLNFYVTTPDVRLIRPATDDGELLTMETKSGLMSIAQPAELEMLKDCFASGYVVVPRDDLGTEQLPVGTVNTLDRIARRIPMPSSHFVLWQWETESPGSGDSCQRMVAAIRP